MEQRVRHEWHFDYLDPSSQWVFVNVTPFARSLGLYITELGHFFQDGECITNRKPENTFSLNMRVRSDDTAPQTTIRFTGGEPMTMPHGEVHDYLLITDNRTGYVTEQYGKNEGYFIQFAGPLAEKYCHVLLGGEPCRLIFFRPYTHYVKIFDELLFLFRQPPSDRRDTYANMLLISLLRRLLLGAEIDTPLQVLNPYVQRAYEILEERFMQPLRMKDVAALLHISPAYLSRLIHQEIGASFADCLTTIRLNHAKQMLQITDIPVEDIALACGFSHASHFIRLFHAKEGLTPLRYRKLRRHEQEETT